MSKNTFFKFQKNYFLLAVLLFLVEVYIALYVRDSIIRPYGGDYLVVIFIYCAVKSCFDISVSKAAMGTLLFSFTIEFAQYFHVVKLIGLQHSKLANIVIGNSFQWVDLLAYTLGILTVFVIEKSKK
jgi:Protein of unknown function (DUF2809)